MNDRAPLESAEVLAATLARKLKRRMPKGWGFVLVMGSFGDEGQDGAATYLSSIAREDALKLLRDTADRIEKGTATR